MNTQQQVLLEEAIRLGDLLLASAIESEHGLSWDCHRHGYDHEPELARKPDLAHGAAGIATFLLDLAEASKEERFRRAALRAADWSAWYCKNHPTENYSFYTGYLGVSWLLARVYSLTQEESYWEQAMEIAAPASKEYLSSPYASHELYHGRSGSLLALLLLYEIKPDERLQEWILAFAEDLLQRVQLHSKGIYWRDRNPGIQPLVSFGQGNAGICFVLRQLAKVTENEAIDYWADEVQAYIGAQWDEKTGYWPDYRKAITQVREHEQHLEAFRVGDTDFFQQPGAAWGWLAGNSGILHLPGIADKKIQRVARKIPAIFAELPHDSLLQGRTGTLLAIKAAGHLNGKSSYLDEAMKLAIKCIEKKKGEYQTAYSQQGIKNDPGLMEGLAGIGYALTHLLSEDSFNLMNPLVSEPIHFIKNNLPDNSALSVNTAHMRKRLLQSAFARTIRILSYEKVEPLKAFLEKKPSGPLRDAFMQWLEEKHLDSGSAQLQDIYHLESSIALLSDQIKSYALINAAEIVRQEEAEALLNLKDSDLLHEMLCTGDDSEAIETQWDWMTQYDHEKKREIRPEENRSKDPDDFLVLIRPNSDGTAILSYPLNELSGPIYQLFTEPTEVSEALGSLLDMFDFDEPAEARQLQKLAVDQIREFINTGILHKG